MEPLRIGTAGWSIPRQVADAFPQKGVGLARYAARFRAVEINSTFYRSHQPATFERWALATPDEFRFAVKAPKAVSHVERLAGGPAAMRAFLAEVSRLGPKLGPVLVQLPPSLAFDAQVAGRFFADLRHGFAGAVVCEPRHASWFDVEAEALFRTMEVARVAADPPPHPAAARPGGWTGLAYWRLHGAPRMYFSPYDDAALATLSEAVEAASAPAWCVFDNTASGAAAHDALRLQALANA